MNPKVWGPHAWVFLHSVTLNYPDSPSDEEKQSMRTFFNSVKKVLPCDKCKIHFKDNLEKFPLTDKVLSSRDSLVMWLIDIHNAVNITTGKPEITYENVVSTYNSMYGEDFITVYITLILLLVVLVLLVILIKSKNLYHSC